MCGSAAPQHQLREEGAAAGARRSGGGAGGGAGAGGGPEAGAGKGACPLSRPPPRTIDTICGRRSRPTAPSIPFLPGLVVWVPPATWYRWWGCLSLRAPSNRLILPICPGPKTPPIYLLQGRVNLGSLNAVLCSLTCTSLLAKHVYHALLSLA